ncbi:YraN family protein [Alteromonas lipotrueiana]|uniref:YraN family protein n=1 Tax=Alteromonas lipotrueiana TaxID=2803815 RepID=UPI001C4568C6|nr:YraN family protein [Alteromonas lipotrueiana]
MSRRLGQQAEQRAVTFLQQQGLTLVACNVHSRFGELDIVMRDGAYWVCVEVKARASHHHGHPAEFVTAAKLTKMTKTFVRFLIDQGHNPNHTPQRFDVVTFNNDHLQWFKNIAG